jgi:hypothetical protein
MKIFFFILILINSFVLNVKANLDSLLTGIENIKGIKLSETPRNFKSTDLYEMIDGGAEIYIEYGFHQALDVAYLFDSTDRIGIQIYEMTDAPAAYGIFSSSRNEDDSSMQIGSYSAGNAYYIMVQKGNYFYIVSSDNNSTLSRNTNSVIAKVIASNIAESGQLPDLVKGALNTGFKIENIKYIKGTIGLSGSYFFGHQDIFKTSNSIYIDDGEFKLFVFQYSDSLSACNQFNSVNQELISTNRYTQFKIENFKSTCLDRNLKYINIYRNNNYIIMSIGKDLDEDMQKKLFFYF